MSDRHPYLEIEDTTAAGPLYALHNLTPADIAQLMDALRSRRLLQTLRLQEEALPPNVRAKLRADNERLDIIHSRLTPSLHDHHLTAEGPPMGNVDPVVR